MTMIDIRQQAMSCAEGSGHRQGSDSPISAIVSTADSHTMANGQPSSLVQELFLLQRVAQRISSTLDIDTLLDDIVNDVGETFGYSRSGILLKDATTNELVIAAVRGWTVNFHTKGDRFAIGEYGMVGHVGATGETYYAPDVRLDPYYQVSEEQTRSEVDIPLKVRGRLIGVFNAQHNEVNAFSDDRIRVLEALAGHIAIALENARVFQKERRERQRMSKELDEARVIQRSLFPADPQEVTGAEVRGLCLPCQEVGGDWYDFIPCRDGRLGIALGDVSGKGMGAALLMSSTRSVLRLVTTSAASPADALSRINRILMDDLPIAKFITMTFALLGPGGHVVFANAGHPPPLLVTGRGADFLHTDSGLPLGIQECGFAERTCELAPGDRLFFYSDGITEAMDPSMDQYGESRLRSYMAAPQATLQSLLDDVRSFMNGHPPSDDVTAVMVRVP